MSSKWFSKITSKFLGPKKVRMSSMEAGPNPKPDFRQVGKSPEDTSGFPVNK